MSEANNSNATRQFSDYQQISFEANLAVTPEVRTVKVNGEDRAVVDLKVISNVVRGNQQRRSVRIVTFWGGQANAVAKSGVGKGDRVRIDATDAYENANEKEGTVYNEIRMTGTKFSILFRKNGNGTSTAAPATEQAPELQGTDDTNDIPF